MFKCCVNATSFWLEIDDKYPADLPVLDNPLLSMMCCKVGEKFQRYREKMEISSYISNLWIDLDGVSLSLNYTAKIECLSCETNYFKYLDALEVNKPIDEKICNHFVDAIMSFYAQRRLYIIESGHFKTFNDVPIDQLRRFIG